MAIREINQTTYEFNVEAPTMLLYGGPGSGKTRFLGTMPKVYIVSLDHGLKGLKLAGFKFDGVEVDTYDELEQVIDEILLGTRAQQAMSFGLDHLTMVTDLSATKRKLRDAAPNMKRSIWGTISDDVRIINKKFLDIAYKRNAPVCVVAHQQIEKDELLGNVMGLPDTVGKFATNVGGLFDMYLYARQETTPVNGQWIPTWKISTVNYMQFQAKDRTGILDVEETNDFPVFIDKIRARVAEIKASEGGTNA